MTGRAFGVKNLATITRSWSYILSIDSSARPAMRRTCWDDIKEDEKCIGLSRENAQVWNKWRWRVGRNWITEDHLEGQNKPLCVCVCVCVCVLLLWLYVVACCLYVSCSMLLCRICCQVVILTCWVVASTINIYQTFIIKQINYYYYYAEICWSRRNSFWSVCFCLAWGYRWY